MKETVGRSFQLLVKAPGGKSSPRKLLQLNKMRFFAVICCIGLAQSGLVRREADAEPEADAEAQYYGYGVAAPLAVVAPLQLLQL